MPILQNARQEAFAAARARGARLEDAYEDAGFVPDKSHACRLANRPDVAERVAELRRNREDADDAAPEAIIAALVRLAKDGETAKTPAGIKETRLNLLEAYRLRTEQTAARRMDRDARGAGYA